MAEFQELILFHPACKPSSQSIEEAAWRAGMDPDQWRAIEAGERMATRAEMSLVARGVQMSGADLATLVIFCQLLAA